MATMISALMRKVASGMVPLIAVDRGDLSPLYRQIYEQYRMAILEGRLRSGQRIPSSRGLALELGISRIPVFAAYAQLLAEGYLESRVGAGTVVSNLLPDRLTSAVTHHRAPVQPPSRGRTLSRRSAVLPPAGTVVPLLGRWGSFLPGQPALDHFPLPVWSRLIMRHSRNAPVESLHYGDPMGSLHLRESIAGYLRTARAVRCEARQIMIVSGTQQGLDISVRVLLDPGMPVWVEDPGYRLARDVLAAAECRMVPVPVDEQGLNVAAGIERCRKARAALVTPSHQYPLGVTLSASRRLELLDWADRSGSWIIEDDYDSEFRFESMPIASLQGFDSHSRVIYLGTFSKILCPSLRLGYVVIPPDLVERFVAVRLAMDVTPPSFLQAVLADFIAEGHLARHVRRMRALYKERREALVHSLGNDLGFTPDILGGDAGMHLTVTIPNRFDDGEIAARAARQNLWLLPLSRAYAGDNPRRGFVLGYGSTPAKEMPDAFHKFRAAFHH